MGKEGTIEAESLTGILAQALPLVDGAKKTSNNPAFKSKYADLGSVIAAIRPIAEHGLWYRQVAHEHEGGVSVETFYVHENGELSAGSVFVPASKDNAHGYGSAQTYARRYGLQLAFGLATEDDDGNAAAEAPPKRQEKHSKLKSEIRAFVHELEGIGDWDTWVAFRETDDFKRITTDCAEKLPGWWEGWDEQPDGFVPLQTRIRNKIDDLAQSKASLIDAG